MKNPFTQHPNECSDESWGQHCQFALSVSIRLTITAIIFVIHGIFPFIRIPRWLNLEESIRFLKRKNDDREKRHGK